MVYRSTFVVEANELLASGKNVEAVKLLEDAATRLDPDALHELAIWHVYGYPVSRDFRVARRLFKTAGQAGHFESARTHAVFIALGAGGSKDWRLALEKLHTVAAQDPIAARQSALLENMGLNRDGSPVDFPTLTPVSASPRLAVVENLLSADECDHVMDLSDPRLVPSVVVDPKTGLQIPHPIRTSAGTVLGPIQQDLVIHAINMRIAALTQTRQDQGEPLAVLRYSTGQQYREHHDCLPNENNQRIMTLITYLNDGYEGGTTHFPEIEKNVYGKRGGAALFWNVLPDGRVDYSSRHTGTPVTRGTKWVCTRWIRRETFDPWGMLEN